MVLLRLFHKAPRKGNIQAFVKDRLAKTLKPIENAVGRRFAMLNLNHGLRTTTMEEPR